MPSTGARGGLGAPEWLFRPISAAYLALVAGVGPLLIYSVNVHRISVGNPLLGAFLLLLGLLSARLILALALRGPRVTDPLLALAAMALLYNALAGIEPGSFVMALWMVGFAALGVVVIAVPGLRTRVEGGLVIFLGVLTASLLVNIATSPVWPQRMAIEAAFADAFPPLQQPSEVGAERPDIYYLVFDRYARSDILQTRYGFDDSAFLDALRARGFAVSPQAVGAYQRTAHSVASTLNLDYLPQFASSSDWVPLYRRLSEPRLYATLKQLGYRIETFGSWWEPTRESALADRNENFFAVPESVRPIAENSLLADLLARMGLEFFDARVRHCWRVNQKFAAVGRGGGVGPTFTFAHFLMPHPPFVVDASGNCKSVAAAQAMTRAQNYAEQVRYTDEATLAMVDRILARDSGAIIVIQSDEGPWPARYAGEEIARFGADVTAVDWDRVEPEDLREKMSILSAIRFPSALESVASPRFAPVNTFRAILREQFGFDLPDLARRAYVFKSDADIYSYEPVLEVLDDQ